MTNPILLKNILLDDSESDILISDGRIQQICPSGSGKIAATPEVEVVECEGKAAFPGLVNMHTHAGMAMMRGVGEDISFHEWIDRIWEIEKDIDEEYVYHATKVACLEMIKTGTTAFNDQYWYVNAARKAASELGIRPMLSYVILDHNDPFEAERQKQQCQKVYEESLAWNDMTVLLISIHAIYSVSEDMIIWATRFAREHGLKIHIHVSETMKEVEDCKAAHGGMSPVEYLDCLGVLGPDVIAAHTLWLSENDIRILGERGVTCVHNINSNLKLSSGYKFLYNELRDAGANVCIGTDGCASSNNLDMLEAMKTSAVVQKAWREDSSAMPLKELIAMATTNSGKAFGLDLGRIVPGALADMIIVDVQGYQFLSPGSFEANLVYSAHSDVIDSVICNGRFIMRNRVVPGEKEIIAEARKAMTRLSSLKN